MAKKKKRKETKKKDTGYKVELIGLLLILIAIIGFIPNTGPSEGSLRANIDFLPILDNPSAIAIETVVFPSPNGVGFIAVTNINFPSFLSFSFSYTELEIFALYFP